MSNRGWSASLVRACATVALAGLLAPSGARAGCNIIPPVEQAFPSTVASITSPIATPGNQVELSLSPCDVLPDGSVASFDSTSAVTINFLPADPAQPPPVTVDPGTITLANCTGVNGTTPPCTTLRFPMPDTSALAPFGLAGTAEIVVTNGTTEVAHIGPLFQPHEIGSSCDKQPETVFQQFTVLPPPNPFATLVFDLTQNPPIQTQVLATLDGSGSLLIPIDWQAVLHGVGNPVAQLVSGGLNNVRAFQSSPDPIRVTSDDVRSF